MLFSTQIPADNDALRDAIYQGHIFKLSPTPESLATVDYCAHILESAFGTPLETAPDRLPQDERMAAIANARRQVLNDPAALDLVRTLIQAHGFILDKQVFDPLRLRSVFSGGHKRPEAERAYAMHRDTWFANPQCQINWWLALHDVPEERSFSFYPAYFNKPLRNTSADFDYDAWMHTVGWQGSNGRGDVAYPCALEKPEGSVSFSCKKGEIILFSAAHLHQTNPNDTGLSRFSADFRTVHIGDHMAGKGAPNADNGASSEALMDYVA